MPNLLLRILSFWKKRPKTVIPKDIQVKSKSMHHYEKAAAVKVIKFAKRHFIEVDELDALFNAELIYEQKKYQARHDFPHQAAIRKSDISAAKKEKYEQLKISLNESLYRKYRVHRQKQRKKYPSKDD